MSRVKKRVSYRCRKIMESIKDLIPAFVASGNEISMKKYPSTLGDWLDNDGKLEVVDPIVDNLILKMHERGIIHGDLHANNIVITPGTKNPDIRFIDFDEAMYIDEVAHSKDAIARIATFWQVDEFEHGKVDTIDALLAYERNMWKIGYESDAN